jgi:hypothetical protein
MGWRLAEARARPMSRADIRRARRDSLAAGIARVARILERDRWPTGLDVTPRERIGLQRTLQAMREDLRQAPSIADDDA